MNTLDQLSRMAADYLADWDDQYKGPLRNYWGERTVLELQYAARIAAGTGQAGEDLVNQAIAAAWADFTAEGSLTRPGSSRCCASVMPTST